MNRPKAASTPAEPAVAASIGSLLMLLVLVYAWVLAGWFTDVYYQGVQEDEALEWATFWAFLAAAAVFVMAALRQRRREEALPWFLSGVALFCFFVAGEEISWGQRLAGYRPSTYFLENNFQQEANLHNIPAVGIRKLALKTVILGYGVVLPLIALVPALGRLLRRISVVAPPWQLVPGFIGTYILYEAYPWSFSGEWVECMLGLGFLFAGVLCVGEFRAQPPVSRGRWNPAVAVTVAWLAMIAAGAASATISRTVVSGNPELLQAARIELEALHRDFTSGKVGTRCNLHKRLHSFRTRFSQNHLLKGQFAALTAQGLPDARAEYLLDPWNSPYWLRDHCQAKQRVTFIYSFGPDRRRQSSSRAIMGDDIGTYLREAD